MKILYHHRIASKDGQYVHIEELTKAFDALGHELKIISPAVSDGEFGSEGGVVSVLKRYMPKFIYELLEFMYAFVAYFKLRRAVKEFQPDFIYERYNLFMPAGIWLKKWSGLPFVSEINAPLYEERSKYNGISLKSLASWSEKYVWKNADLLLPVTEVLAKRVISKGGESNKIEVIHNGINIERFDNVIEKTEAKNRLGLGDVTVLGFTGFVRDWHGLDRVVELIANEDDCALLVVGDGPAKKSLLEQAKNLGVSERVIVTGVIGRNDVADYISAFDIALQPDVVDYASPLKLFEYLALGKPVVAPDKSNIREILSHQETGYLFESNKQQAFVMAVKHLLDDNALRDKLGVAAKNLILEKKYLWMENARRIIQRVSNLSSEVGR